MSSLDRPSDAEYNRYAYLVEIVRDYKYNEELIRKYQPFLVQDVLFNTLLVQANRDLARIAEILEKGQDRLNLWVDKTAAAMNAKLWDDDHAIYFDCALILCHHIATGYTTFHAGLSAKAPAE